MMLDQGHDFSKVKFRVAREEFYITPDRKRLLVDWAGLYTPGVSASEGEIAVHINKRHRGSVAQTIVHEALHHVAYYKTLPGYRLNKVEAAALRDMKKLLKHAEKVAISKNMGAGESMSQVRARLAKDTTLYGLTNIDEFITEILSDENFQRFLNEIKPMQGIQKKGGLIRTLLDQIFAYLKDFIYGFDVSGDSLLSQGLDNVMALIQTPQTEAGVQSAMASLAQGDFASRATKEQRLNAEAARVSNIQNNEKRIPFIYKTGSDRANQSRGPQSIGRLQELFKRPDDRRSESAIETGARRRSEISKWAATEGSPPNSPSVSSVPSVVNPSSASSSPAAPCRKATLSLGRHLFRFRAGHRATHREIAAALGRRTGRV
jgi:hypothetical protein